MKHLIFPSSIIASTFIFLSGCASYNASSLSTLAPEAVFSSLVERQDLVVVAKAFNKADCKRYLDRDVLAEGYQPVQLYIENNGEKDYVFSLNKISLSFARSEEVAEKVHTSTVGRAVGYGVGAVVFLPITWPLAIPAIVDGIKSSEANQALDNDFSTKAASDQVIYSHSYFNKILFVPINDYQPNFRITLTEKDSKRIREIEVVTS
jgi:hypothetical protein